MNATKKNKIHYVCSICNESKAMNCFRKTERTKGSERCNTCLGKGSLVKPTKLTCVGCSETLSISTFPKNERTKGKNARCGNCAKKERDQTKKEKKNERKTIVSVISEKKEVALQTHKKMSTSSENTVRKTVFQRDRSICHYCHQAGAETIDHKIPIFLGGPTTVENCVCACAFCNHFKGNMPYQDFLSVLHHFPAYEWLELRRKWMALL